MWEGALFTLLHSSVSECGGCFCIYPTVVWALWIHDLNKEGTWDRWMDQTQYLLALQVEWRKPEHSYGCRQASDGLAACWTKHRAANQHQTHWKTMAAESGSERLCCNHMRQFLYLHWCPNFGRCDERRCAEPTLSSLVSQTIALDVQRKSGRKQAVDLSESAFPHGNNLGDDH